MKKRGFILLLACLLLMPLWAQGAVVMGNTELAQRPVGEETPAVPEISAPQTAPAVTAPAVLAEVHDHSGWTELTAAETLTTGEYVLADDITGNLVISANATVSLCLNGHTIDAGGSGSVITVNAGATLNLYDCSASATGKITGGTGTSSGGLSGGGIFVNRGTLNFYGGTITENTADNGAGVRVLNGNFTMYGGTIKSNAATAAGGGVLVTAGTFVMEAGNISGNTAKNGGGIGVNATNIAVVSGGTIADNIAVEEGGGLQMLGSSEVTVTGGTISGNQAAVGGGICMNSMGTLSLSGAPLIQSNQDTSTGATGDIYLASGKTITLGALGDSISPVGVTMAEPGTFTGVGNGESASGFVSGDARYTVGTDDEGQLFLGALVAYYRPEGVEGDLPAPAQKVYPLGTSVPVDTTYPLTKAGYTQTGWSSANSLPTTPKKAFPSIGQNVTLYPIFLRSFQATAEEDTVRYNYREAKEVRLSDYVCLSDSTITGTTFSFGVQNGTLPEGLSLQNGVVTGAPTVNVGDYEVIFNVADSNAITLFSLEPVIAYQKGTLTLTFSVERATPVAGDLTFTAPGDLTYNGGGKSAVLAAAEGRNGMGDITLKYSSDEGQTYFNQAPTTVGTYTVTVDIAQGTNYNAVNGLTDPSWHFTITKATPSYDVPTGLTATVGQTLADVALLDGWSWDNKNLSVGDVGSHEFSATFIPVDPTNYNTVTKNLTVTVSEAVPASVQVGTPAWDGSKTTIQLTQVTPADLLSGTGTQVFVAQYDENKKMQDVCTGTLSGNTLTISGKRVAVGEGWKIFFLNGSSAPLCQAKELK